MNNNINEFSELLIKLITSKSYDEALLEEQKATFKHVSKNLFGPISQREMELILEANKDRESLMKSLFVYIITHDLSK